MRDGREQVRSISGRWQQQRWCLKTGFVVYLLALKQRCIIGRPKNIERQTDHASRSVFFFFLTGILDLDGGVGLRVRLVNHLSADLLCQNLHRQTDKQTEDEWPLVKCPDDHNAEQD